jgi:hypothetical protein
LATKKRLRVAYCPTGIIGIGGHNRQTPFGAFLRLYVADGDASPATIRNYYGNAVQFVAWCGEHDINPATVTGDDIALIRPGGQAGDRYLELSETPEKGLTKTISYGIINEK